MGVEIETITPGDGEIPLPHIYTHANTHTQTRTQRGNELLFGFPLQEGLSPKKDRRAWCIMSVSCKSQTYFFSHTTTTATTPPKCAFLPYMYHRRPPSVCPGCSPAWCEASQPAAAVYAANSSGGALLRSQPALFALLGPLFIFPSLSFFFLSFFLGAVRAVQRYPSPKRKCSTGHVGALQSSSPGCNFSSQ